MLSVHLYRGKPPFHAVNGRKAESAVVDTGTPNAVDTEPKHVSMGRVYEEALTCSGVEHTASSIKLLYCPSDQKCVLVLRRYLQTQLPCENEHCSEEE